MSHLLRNIDRRMRQAWQGLAQSRKSDYLVINEQFERALADIRAILRSRHLRREEQQSRYANLMNSL